MTRFGLALFAAILATTASYAAAPPPKSDPLKGVVVGDEVVTCTDVENRSNVNVYVHSLRHDTKVRGRWCALVNRSPIRWQIGHGAFWFSFDWDFTGVLDMHMGGGILERIDLALLSKEGEIFNRLDAR